MAPSQPSPMKRALIVGATSSLAVAIAHQLAASGVDLLLAGRDAEELERIKTDLAIRHPIAVKTIALDLANTLDMDAFCADIGEVDGAFVLAGDMGEANAATPDNIAHVIGINFTSCAILTAALANHMKERGGVIALISSVAGDRGRASNFVYGSAKAGLTAFASGLRAQLSQAKSGVHVLTVKPGFVDTPMTYAMNSPLTAAREKVAREIITAANKRKNSIYTPRLWWLIMLIIQHIPEVIFKRLKF